MSENATAKQARRVAFMFKELINGKRFTTSQMRDALVEKFGPIDLRSVQRDLKLLCEEIEIIEPLQEGRKNIWHIPAIIRRSYCAFRVESNELLSFHVLKAHLKTFKGTMIADEVKKLSEKLDSITPGLAFSEDSLYWDQNIGQYDYTEFDNIIKTIIESIVQKKWVEVEYNTGHRGNIKSYTVMPRKMFTYAGSLYVAAFVPYYKTHIAMSIQNFEGIKYTIPDKIYAVPKFNFKQWQKGRFGVFWGKSRKVELKIMAHYKHYFESRTWHRTQKISYDNMDNMIIKMRVPISPDFISWILSWGEVITVIKPVDLIKEINYKLNITLKNYS